MRSNLLYIGCVIGTPPATRLKPKTVNMDMRYAESFGNSPCKSRLAAAWLTYNGDSHISSIRLKTSSNILQ